MPPVVRADITIVAGQAPARSHTLQASREVVCGLSQTHWRHSDINLGGGGQLDEQDVIVDGVAVVVRMLEHLGASNIIMTSQ